MKTLGESNLDELAIKFPVDRVTSVLICFLRYLPK